MDVWPDEIRERPEALAFPADLERSAALEAMGLAEARACWRNAGLGAVILGDAVQYVEGYAVTEFGFPLAHGFLIAGGRIVDPTYYAQDVARHDPPLQEVMYYPVLLWSGERMRTILQALTRRRQNTLPLYDHHPDLRRVMFLHERRIYEAILGASLAGLWPDAGGPMGIYHAQHAQEE